MKLIEFIIGLFFFITVFESGITQMTRLGLYIIMALLVVAFALETYIEFGGFKYEKEVE